MSFYANRPVCRRRTADSRLDLCAPLRDSFTPRKGQRIIFSRAQIVELLCIRWTGGDESNYPNVAADRLMRISNLPGDCNADAIIGATDINGFLAALLGQADAPLCITDLNSDGATDGADIQDFVVLLVSGG